jgi:anaerobic magnesium-protoporphyrin IX monomethyl ester cyclase
MKVVLLSPNPPDCVAFGPRQLASVLRLRGITCEIVFLRGSVKHNSFDSDYVYQYADSIIDGVLKVCADADVVGVSFMSLYFDRAVQLTHAVQRTGKKVIWGGTHPTLRPDQSIRIADFVCVGEGERAFIAWLDRLAAGGTLTDVPGIWARSGTHIHDNGTAPEVDDLEALPWPDMDTEGHWVDWDDQIVPMTTQRMYDILPRLPAAGGRQHIGVRVMATRGCPHKCTYCASSAQTKMRRRSPESTIRHMEWLKARYPFIQAVYEFDDTFFATRSDWLAEYAEKYKQRVHLPMHCQTSPSTLTQKKLDLLVDAGLVFCEMGIQSGSDEVKELFLRTETEQQVLRAAEVLRDYWASGKLLPPRYHVITDVPWESAASVRQTVQLLLRLPRPFTLAIGSLCLFPGTALNDRATREGLLWDEVQQVYRKPFLHPKPNLLNWLIYASGLDWIPKPALEHMAQPSFLNRFAADAGLKPTRTAWALHRTTSLLDRIPRAADALRNLDTERVRLAFQQPK